MAHHPILSGSLLGIAVAICVLCAIGLAIMRDAYQRLQFSGPVVSVAITLIVVAIWIEDPVWQSRIKATLILLILFFTNAILSHATARAIRIRDAGGWPPTENKPASVAPDQGAIGEVKKNR